MSAPRTASRVHRSRARPARQAQSRSTGPVCAQSLVALGVDGPDAQAVLRAGHAGERGGGAEHLLGRGAAEAGGADRLAAAVVDLRPRSRAPRCRRRSSERPRSPSPCPWPGTRRPAPGRRPGGRRRGPTAERTGERTAQESTARTGSRSGRRGRGRGSASPSTPTSPPTTSGSAATPAKTTPMRRVSRTTPASIASRPPGPRRGRTRRRSHLGHHVQLHGVSTPVEPCTNSRRLTAPEQPDRHRTRPGPPVLAR